MKFTIKTIGAVGVISASVFAGAVLHAAWSLTPKGHMEMSARYRKIQDHNAHLSEEGF